MDPSGVASLSDANTAGLKESHVYGVIITKEQGHDRISVPGNCWAAGTGH
jgi:hypothetical protein